MLFHLFFNIFLCIIVYMDLCLLPRYQKSTNSYAPYNKDWIKEKIYVLLRRQAARSQWVVDTAMYVPWSVAPVVPTFQDLYFFFLCCIDGQYQCIKTPQHVSPNVCTFHCVCLAIDNCVVLTRGLRLWQWHHYVFKYLIRLKLEQSGMWIKWLSCS